jgi:antibiotic biosynthesis monooxygenase (ABM) superfamily enzyme
MEILYPVSTRAPRDNALARGSVTVLVDREVPVAQEAAFLATLEGLLEAFGRFPGSSGSLVFRREAAGQVAFSILQRFATEADHDAWLASPSFARWREAIAPPEPAPAHVRRYSGMEAFFVSDRAPAAPPRWKMAVVLFLAVMPMSLAMSLWVAPALAHLSLFTGSLLTSVGMVVAMTYAVVPILTTLFQPWLQPSTRGSGAR